VRRYPQFNRTPNKVTALNSVGVATSGGNFTLVAGSGTFVWIGTNATLTPSNQTLTAGAGAFIITGNAADLLYSGASPFQPPVAFNHQGRTDSNGYLEITLSLQKGAPDAPLTPGATVRLQTDRNGRLLCVKGS
jgi:hypothetical protein